MTSSCLFRFLSTIYVVKKLKKIVEPKICHVDTFIGREYVMGSDQYVKPREYVMGSDQYAMLIFF